MGGTEDTIFQERWKRLRVGALPPSMAPDETIREELDDGLVAKIPEKEPAKEVIAAEKEELQIVGVLGRGGMAKVLLGHQPSLQRDVAVKVLTTERASQQNAERLLQEALLTGALEHPGIVPVHTIGKSAEGFPAIVMKRVDGVCWKDLVQDPANAAWTLLGFSDGSATMRLQAHLEILLQLCNALHFAHTRGVLHRDIKPHNVMLGAFGEVYLVDWGIACTLREVSNENEHAETLVGTPAYMAPELFSGAAQSVRTDVYLLGAVLYELLTGHPPHRGNDRLELFQSVFRATPPELPESAPKELAQLCQRAMAHNPEERPASAAVFRDALREYLQHRGSRELSAQATKTLSQLQTLVASPDAQNTQQALTIARLGGECRFAFLQALREWSKNNEARQGLAACLLLLCKQELARENADSARVLLSEYEEQSEREPAQVQTLRTQLATVEAAQQHTKNEARAFAQLQKEQDLRVGAKERTLMALAMFVVTTAVAIPFLNKTIFTMPMLVEIAVIFNVTLWLLILLFRKRVFANTIAQQLTLVIAIMPFTMLVQRLLDARAGVLPLDDVRNNLINVSSTTATAAVLGLSGFRILALLGVLSTLLTVLFPAQVPAILAGFTFLILFVVLVISAPTAFAKNKEP